MFYQMGPAWGRGGLPITRLVLLPSQQRLLIVLAGPGLDRSPPNMPLQGPFTPGITTTPQKKEEERKTNGPGCELSSNTTFEVYMHLLYENVRHFI
jgi:hypothetical protein